MQKRNNILRLVGLCFCLFLFLHHSSFLYLFVSIGNLTTNKATDSSQNGKRSSWQTWHTGHSQQHATDNVENSWLGSQLMNQIITQIAFGGSSSNNNTGSCRNQQGRNLIYQALTYSQQCVVLQGLLHCHITLYHTDDKTTGNVDDNDNNCRNGIALNKFAGTIHSTVEISLSLNLFTPLTGFSICNSTLIQIRINSHLLTRHSIQGKAGRYLSYTLSTLGDNQELNDNQNNEDNETYNCITTNYEITKGTNNLSCIALQQNKSC